MNGHSINVQGISLSSQDSQSVLAGVGILTLIKVQRNDVVNLHLLFRLP